MKLKGLEKAELRKVGDLQFTKTKENIITMGISDLGFLLRSGTIKEEGNYLVISYDAPYAFAVNTGSKPHKVNPEDWEGWVRRKLGHKGEKEIKKIAFLISRKIKKFGTKPQPFFDKAIQDVKIKFRG